MATLTIEAKKSDGVIGYTLVIDGTIISIGADDKVQAQVSGTCGDGSSHILLYGFEGAAGETLTVTGTCAGAEVLKLKEAKIPPAAAPFGGGKKSFKL